MEDVYVQVAWSPASDAFVRTFSEVKDKSVLTGEGGSSLQSVTSLQALSALLFASTNSTAKWSQVARRTHQITLDLPAYSITLVSF